MKREAKGAKYRNLFADLDHLSEPQQFAVHLAFRSLRASPKART